MLDISTNFYNDLKKKKNISDKCPFVYNNHNDSWKTKWHTKGRLTVFHYYFGAIIFMELVNFTF